MKVLITGGNGFLGSYFVKHWSGKGNDVLTLGRGDNSDIRCDIKAEVPKIEQDIDYVIHIAGKAHSVPKTKADEEDFYNVNVNGTVNLLKGLENKGIKGLMFISSVAVYGAKDGSNITEENELKATDSYGKTKIEAEKIITEWSLEQKITVSIIRPPLIIGKNAPGNLGKMITGIEKGRYFNIADGNAKRSVVLAEDLAEFSTALITIGGVYNLTDGFDASFHQLSDVISKKKNKKRVKNMPLWLAKGIAKIGDSIEMILKKEAPFSTKKLKQMTTDLTFSSDKATAIGWRPKKVVTNVELWIN
ncbi:NAD-dependent epimerase/dehydratase family protein [Maribacter sp. SA7]|uniref:NAD-dependent epimerase/dehydratase family protein n=1 Tax=Maribacter zhoushanensis TaxID=3030012 RepID=UPI0023EAF5B1|nr:NAD-dependent epimerase/dehydratase family protein [Maribacter zhoushanensis]MDF4204142.1 NAD-dependent epimerase/dehydratase family protein [Maribacter zhoushanensis]